MNNQFEKWRTGPDGQKYIQNRTHSIMNTHISCMGSKAQPNIFKPELTEDDFASIMNGSDKSDAESVSDDCFDRFFIDDCKPKSQSTSIKDKRSQSLSSFSQLKKSVNKGESKNEIRAEYSQAKQQSRHSSNCDPNLSKQQFNSIFSKQKSSTGSTSNYVSKPKDKLSKEVKKQKQKINFQIVGRTQVSIDFSFNVSSDVLKVLKSHNCVYERERRSWLLDLKGYWPLVNEMIAIVNQNQYQIKGANEDYDIEIMQIPKFVFRAMSTHLQSIRLTKLVFKGQKGNITIDYTSDYELDESHKYSLRSLNKKMQDSLYDFQRKGILFGIERKGRILLADEMGVGKSIQALGIISVFREDWPVLILCPASLKYNWRNEILNWLGLSKEQVQIVNHIGDKILHQKQQCICIASFEMGSKDLFITNIKQAGFKTIIADEAHYLKSGEAKRTKNLLPILKESKRLLLLTGTPIFAKPDEIFNLASAIRPDFFSSFNIFSERYCIFDKGFYKRTKIEGAQNMRELNFLLENFMIRRLKKDVLDQLPEKSRQKVEIEVDDKKSKIISILLSKSKDKIESYLKTVGSNLNVTDYIQKLDKKEDSNEFDLFEDAQDEAIKGDGSLYSKAYRLTGEAKIEGIKLYASYLIDEGQKFLLFVHHKCVMNELEDFLVHKKVGFIRIDGSVKAEERQIRVDKFQKNESVRVALLSITACNSGLTLTEASIVVFGELFFTPAIMNQAEDRAHRIGQKKNVQVKYLIGVNTLDEAIFSALDSKVQVVTEAIDGNKQNLQIDKSSRLEQNVLLRRTQKTQEEISTLSKPENRWKDEDNKVLRTIRKDKDNKEVPNNQRRIDGFFKTTSMEKDKPQVEKKKVDTYQNTSKIQTSNDSDMDASTFFDENDKFEMEVKSTLKQAYAESQLDYPTKLLKK